MQTSRYFVPSNTEKTFLMAKVHKILQSHVGAQHPITGKEIAQALHEADDRKIRACISELLRGGIPVASSVGSNPGYYLVVTGDEAWAYRRVMESRIREDTERLEAFKRATNHLNVPQQAVMI